MIASPSPDMAGFAGRIARWQKQSGRRGLPWQDTKDPYRIWLSEIMLQQTQVVTVMTYYARFLARFPTIHALAQAEQDEVMPYWAGLGYYARARNLHRCARVVCEQWQGRFPTSADEIAQLPGIGRSTAAAIAAFAYGERSPIMDGNVKRVFTRYFGISGDPARRETEKKLWDAAEEVLARAKDDLDMTAYTQGLMDLGSSHCARKADCRACPLHDDCHARLTSRQAELPTPRKRKQQDQRRCAMLVLESEAGILLEQRPSEGIWGGLWSLPQFDDGPALRQACRQRGLSVAEDRRMAGLQHVFSHFKLDIEPWHVICAVDAVSEPAPNQAWMPVSALPEAALPAPVRKILDGLFPA